MILDKVACIVTREQHQERINEVVAEHEPLLVVTEDRVKSHNHVDILEVRAEVVVESVQDGYIRMYMT